MANQKYVAAPVGISLTVGEMLRVTREAQEMTQADLAEASGIPQPTISALESGRDSLGVDRAEKLARALRVHPAILVWPNWEPEAPSKRAVPRRARQGKSGRRAGAKKPRARQHAKA